jgi:signal transduction histidine kinase
VVADERAAKQMIVNLLANAIKFTPSGGSVELLAQAGGHGGVDIAVADSGIGIAAEELPRVLEPFYQARDAAVRQQVGTGLGLTLVKALIELHGGDLDLHSTPGRGTTATLHFPAAA